VASSLFSIVRSPKLFEYSDSTRPIKPVTISRGSIRGNSRRRSDEHNERGRIYSLFGAHSLR
jgi:hypothetical protein